MVRASDKVCNAGPHLCLRTQKKAELQSRMGWRAGSRMPARVCTATSCS